MRTFLINCSNLKNGGGLQVANSICGQLHKFPQYRFVVVLSSALVDTRERLEGVGNTEVVTYDIRNNIPTMIFGRDKILDALVRGKSVNVVLTIFGPSRWRPRVPHLCGFARAQLIIKDSPYHATKKERAIYMVWKWAFRRSSDTFYTENSYISRLLPDVLGKNIKVFTITNYYNQVFDCPDKWNRNIKLLDFDGVTMLTVSSPSPHKNLQIMVPVAEYLERHYPEFLFRFVLTTDEGNFPMVIPEDIRQHFVFVGKIDVSECPFLYEQADIMFMPTLLECFTATYPEAMRMEVPIVTTDLEFARGLCGDAACYYSAIDPVAAAEAIYKVATDKKYAARLVTNGKEQLKKFDNYEQRAEKLVGILEEMVAQ